MTKALVDSNEIQFTGGDDTQSGQRFLDSSDPRLIRHVATCEAAGGEGNSLPAGKDEKLSREFEGGALISAAGAVPSSLVSLKNKCNSGRAYVHPRPSNRSKYCARWSIRGLDTKSGKTITRRLNCGMWTCSYCGPRKAKRARHAIKLQATAYGLSRMITLTLAPKNVPHGVDPVKHMRKTFAKFRIYLIRKYGTQPNYIRVIEFTKKGMPHLHILIDCYIPQKWIKSKWSRLGGGTMVDIRGVSIKHVAKYVSKYLTKDLLLSAPKGTRRISTSRSIKLYPQFDSGIKWELLQESIWCLLGWRNAATWQLQRELFNGTSVQVDEEGILLAFETSESG